MKTCFPAASWAQDNIGIGSMNGVFFVVVF